MCSRRLNGVAGIFFILHIFTLLDKQWPDLNFNSIYLKKFYEVMNLMFYRKLSFLWDVIILSALPHGVVLHQVKQHPLPLLVSLTLFLNRVCRIWRMPLKCYDLQDA